MSKFNYKKQSKVEESSTLFTYTVKDEIITIDYPIFCFRFLNKKFNLTKLDKNQKNLFLKQIVALSTAGFDNINIAPRHGMGFEKIPIKILKFTPPGFITQDVKEVYSFRYAGKKPFIVFRKPSTPIFHVLGIDPNFSIYPHGK